MTDIKIKGLEEIEKNANEVILRVRDLSRVALNEVALNIRDKSIAYLQSVGNPIYLGKSMGVHESITNPSSWSINYEDFNTLTLTCNSNHAAIVEFGGIDTGITMVEGIDKFGNPKARFPIGMSQGNVIAVVPRFAIQEGHHYITNTIESQDNKDSSLTKMKDVLRLAIED